MLESNPSTRMPEDESFRTKLLAVFNPRTHTRRPTPATTPLGEGQRSKLKLIHQEFERLQHLTGTNFTRDATADATVAMCSKHSSADIPFGKCDISQDHIWAFPHPDAAESQVNHILDTWSKPETAVSACVLIPQSLSHLVNPFDTFARLIKRYPSGSKILQSATGKVLHTSQPLCAYHISQRPMEQEAHNLVSEPTATPLAFVFKAQCHSHGNRDASTISATVLADTGATARFASLEWVKHHGLPIKQSHANWTVRLADNHTVHINGTVTVDVDIQGYRDTITLLVMPMSKGYDLILGNDWFMKRQAVISYRDYTISLLHRGKDLTLKATTMAKSNVYEMRSPAQHNNTSDSETPHAFVMNMTQAKRQLRKRKDCYILDLQHVTGSQQWTEEQLVAATQAKPLPTEAEREESVRHAIRELQEEVANSKPTPTTENPDETSELQDLASQQLAIKIEALKAEFGDTVFRDKLPGIRTHGEPVEAVPTIPGAKPTVRGTGRYTKHDREELEKQIKGLLADGMIEPSLSPYAAAALLVPKYNADGSIKSWRMVIDYRMLNNITIKYQFPMPRVDDVLDSLNGAQYFSSCDATWGFWQLRLHPDDIAKTAFRTPSGLYQWRVLPFGLANSPAVFQRTMASFFQVPFTNEDGTTVTALGSFIQVYMDDLLIYSKTPEEHLRHVRFVFETLRANGIYLNPKKCEFNKPEVLFLGHLVSKKGIKPNPEKVAVMQDWPAPKNKQDLYKFLGFANYFRLFIRNYATIASPLYPLTQCKTPADFETKWTSIQEACFEALKLALCNAPTLKTPDFDAPFEVIVDASNVAVGAVLTQAGRPVAYESKKLSPAEMRWTTTERELFSAVHALRKWQCYLRHPTQQFTLWTDHNPNTFFSSGSRPLTPRQARWQEFLAPFNFQWKYKKGQDNIADTLSRPPGVEEAIQLAECLIHLNATRRPAQFDCSAVTRSQTRSQTRPVESPSPPKRQKTDRVRFTTDLESVAEGGTLIVPGPVQSHFDAPARLTEFERELWDARLSDFFRDTNRDEQWYQDDRALWHNAEGKLVIPDVGDLRTRVIHACHDSVFSGHLGKTKTLNLCRRLFYWPKMAKQIHEYIRTCPTCQSVKPTNQRPAGRIRPLEVPDGKWTDVTVDMVTDLPKTIRGFDAILVFVDRLTKMCHIVPTTKTCTSEEFVRLFIDNIVKHHGAPVRLISDRGSIFASNFTHAVTANLNTMQYHSTAFHPQTDGQTERMNRIVEDILRAYVFTKQKEWDITLPMVEFAINNTPSEATGQSPFLLNYGVNPRHPAIAQLVSSSPDTTDLAISNPEVFDVMAVALRNVPDVPAATQFAEDMQAAITHTKVMLQAARSRMQHQEKSRRSEGTLYREGDLVMLSTKHIKLLYKGCPKLMPRFVGPFKVTEVINPVAFRLELPKTFRIHNVFHASLLKPFVSRPGHTSHPPPIIVADDEEYEVELLVNRRLKKARTVKAGKHSEKKQYFRYEYLVRWKGYGPEQDEWITEKELLRHCKALIREFDALVPRTDDVLLI